MTPDHEIEVIDLISTALVVGQHTQMNVCIYNYVYDGSSILIDHCREQPCIAHVCSIKIEYSSHLML